MLRNYLKESTEFYKKEDNPLFYLFIIPKLVKAEPETVKQDQELMNLITLLKFRIFLNTQGSIILAEKQLIV